MMKSLAVLVIPLALAAAACLSPKVAAQNRGEAIANKLVTTLFSAGTAVFCDSEIVQMDINDVLNHLGSLKLKLTITAMSESATSGFGKTRCFAIKRD